MISYEISRNPLDVLYSCGHTTMRAYEQAAIAIGRVDAAGSLAPPGLREMLRLRCAAQYISDPSGGMIAQLVPDGERPNNVRAFADALRVGSARAPREIINPTQGPCLSIRPRWVVKTREPAQQTQATKL